MKDRKGFTLPELLVVVAIIGILVAISLPIFSNQIERSRDAVSIANIRSAYAEAQVFYMSPDNATRPQYSKGFTIYNDDGTRKISGQYTGYNSPIPETITVYNVEIKSKKRNDWSGLGDSLPFYNVFKCGSSTPGGDTGVSGYGTIYFKYDESGNLTSVLMSVLKNPWK